MEIQIRVVTVDNEYVVTTCLMDWVALERAYKTTSTQVVNSLSMEHLAFLAYSAAKAAGHTPPARLDDFIRSITDISVVENDETEANPTPEGQ